MKDETTDDNSLTRCDDAAGLAVGDHASAISMMPSSARTDDEKVELYEAVKHTLDQIQENPDLRYYAGWGTQVFYLLVRAEAAHLGKPLDEVETERRKDRQPSYRRREPEVLRLRDKLDELRAQLDGR